MRSYLDAWSDYSFVICATFRPMNRMASGLPDGQASGFSYFEQQAMHAVIVRQFGMKSCRDYISLPHHHRLTLQCSKRGDGVANTYDLRRADEDRLKRPAGKRCLNR